MISYTVASLFMFSVALALNARFNPVFRSKRIVLATLAVAALAQLVADNLTVLRGFWHFNDAATLGIRIPFMPLENLFFGLALCLFTVLFFEAFSRKRSG